jgi:hypothetical protein
MRERTLKLRLVDREVEGAGHGVCWSMERRV